ncbi:hypothetical protein D3C72_1815310 [compost metagenome]
MFQRGGATADDVGVAGLGARSDVADGLAGHGGAVGVKAPGHQQFMHDRGHAARAVEAFAQMLARRHAVDQQRDVFAQALPVIQAQVAAGVAGHRDQVQRAIGGRAQRGRHDDGVLEGLPRQDVGRPQVFAHHVADAHAGGIGHLGAFAVGGGNAGAGGQRHAQRFGQ